MAASEVPLERAAKTQPFPLKPAPLSRMSMTMADIATVTPELEAECRKLIEGVQIGGPYLPPGYKRLRLAFPGNHGGVNWGGMSFNPQLGYLFVNSNEMGQLSGLRDRDPKAGGRAQAEGRRQPRASGGSVRERAGRRPLQVPEPLLSAAAVGSAQRGQRAHRRVTRGASRSASPTACRPTSRRPAARAMAARSRPPAVSCSSAQPTMRGSGRSTRRPGTELWTFKLGGAANATPSTYLGKDGRQYVVTVSTGGGFFEAPLTDDRIMAFALPKR